MCIFFIVRYSICKKIKTTGKIDSRTSSNNTNRHFLSPYIKLMVLNRHYNGGQIKHENLKAIKLKIKVHSNCKYETL